MSEIDKLVKTLEKAAADQIRQDDKMLDLMLKNIMQAAVDADKELELCWALGDALLTAIAVAAVAHMRGHQAHFEKLGSATACTRMLIDTCLKDIEPRARKLVAKVAKDEGIRPEVFSWEDPNQMTTNEKTASEIQQEINNERKI